jgi:hypothetical protein
VEIASHGWKLPVREVIEITSQGWKLPKSQRKKMTDIGVDYLKEEDRRK